MTFPPPGQPPGQPQGQPQSQPPGPLPGSGVPEPPTRQIPTQQVPTQEVPTRQIPPLAAPAQESPETDSGRRWSRDPLSISLVLVIVAALGLAGLLAGELYARHRADTIVAKAVSCIVQDSASASFGARPFLLQHFTHSYRDMVVETAGNRIREAQGMKLRLRLDDIRLNQTTESAGTLGALDADVTWSTDGIQQTVAGIIPFLGGLVSGVSTDPSAGTLELQGPLGTVTVAPGVADGGVTLQVLKVTGLGFSLPRETVQPALDAFTQTLTANLPMGIHADKIEVTETGVAARFITRDATIPNGQQDPCFAGL